MPKFKPPKDEKFAGRKKVADPGPYLNMDEPRKNWYHPNTMGKMRKQMKYDLREEKKKGRKG